MGARSGAFVAIVSLAILTECARSAPEGSADIAGAVLPFSADGSDAVYDASGTMHVLFWRESRCLYSRRPAGSREFTNPVPMDPGGSPAARSPAPRIRTGGSGELYVLWPSRGWWTVLRTGDSGKSWTPVPTDSLRTGSPVEQPALDVSPDGDLYLVWVDGRDPKDPEDSFATHLYLSSSRDRGKTWTVAQKITQTASRACPCCPVALEAGSGGLVRVAYRSSSRNVKECALLTSRDRGRTFQAKTLSSNNWFFVGCPMQGPVLASSGDAVAVAWTSDGHMFESTSADGGATFSPPLRLGRGRFIAAAASASGDVALAWDEGRQLGWLCLPERGPRPRLDMAPRGALAGGPGRHFELLSPAPGAPGHSSHGSHR